MDSFFSFLQFNTFLLSSTLYRNLFYAEEKSITINQIKKPKKLNYEQGKR